MDVSDTQRRSQSVERKEGEREKQRVERSKGRGERKREILYSIVIMV